MQEDSQLSTKQLHALAALLSGETIEATAAAVDCDPATIHRWLRQEPFAEQYRRGRREIVQQASVVMQSGALRAAAIIRELADDPVVPAGVRLRAAMTVYEQSTAWLAVEDLEARLEALEAAAAEGAAHRGRDETDDEST